MADVMKIKPIRRLLIANRGEIARRINRTAREMGISTIAVYADGDARAPFVAEADLAIALHGSSSAETYLDMDKVMAACRRAGADAVHPGYGFLAENAAFAEAVMDAGLAWVGPPPDVIRMMGDKLSARRLMEEAGVPTLSARELKPDDDVGSLAEQIGYPVLVKASAGGGGKGMRVVASAAELEDAVAAAGRESLAAFGDDTLFLERWVTQSRHVEVQILGDNHGNLIHCFERECSIQRRHQKIIEEAPSPAVDAELRQRFGEAALAAAHKLGYASAGTVEFLLSGNEFWFLEVNTRLQVEHPVTEAITGIDLVREQLRIAEGDQLDYRQEDLAIDGHAIEARLYAEDPANDFLPSPARIAVWAPSQAAPARFDSGVESGSEVGIEFDPMLAKVIVHAPTRREAAGRLARVLETTRIHGSTTNRDFLVAALRTKAFMTGDTTTDFIDRVVPDRKRQPDREQLIEAGIAVAMEAQARRRVSAKVLKTIPGGWRNTHMPPEQISFLHGDEEVRIYYRRRRDGMFIIQADGNEYRVRIFAAGAGEADLEIDGRRVRYTVCPEESRWFVHGPTGDVELIERSRFPKLGSQALSGGLTAPMPGNVVATCVKTGDVVKKGQLLLILEAMKMEHRITAPGAGKVTEVHVAEGDQVGNDALLVVVEEDTEGEPS